MRIRDTPELKLGPTVLAACVWALATPLLAQSNAATRPTTTTINGDTGLWFVPTAEILPARGWSVSAGRVNLEYEEGFTDVSNWPATFALGVRDRVELFGAMTMVTRIDRDVRPLFLPEQNGPARPGGVANEHPFVREGWTGSHIGDLWVGAKTSLRFDDRAVCLGARGMVKLPAADDESGAGTGRLDVAADAIVSTEVNRRIELSGVAGFIRRGDPAGVDLVNGVRWGVGTALPTRGSLRLTGEVYGEVYTRDVVQIGARILTIDGDAAPQTSAQTSPVRAAIGLTWIVRQRFYAGAGLNWNVRMPGRSEFGAFRDRPGDAIGLQVRVGYHPGGRHRAPATHP